MYYYVSAHNTAALYAWASDEKHVARYVEWLNRNRDADHYTYRAIAEEECRHDDSVMSMDEPYWDDFMAADDK